MALFRTAGQRVKLRAAIFQPATIYTARINQTFSSLDKVLELAYDTGSGTLADVLPDMTVLIGSTAGAHDVGIVRLRDKDADTFFIGETANVKFANDQYLTVINDFGLWARQVSIVDGEAFMDGGVEYSNQHTNFDPVPIMRSHRVLKLTGATVSTQFDASGSYCLDSSISAYSWSAPGSSSSSGMSTATPTISWNSVGWKVVYLTLTAANGKSFFGVRYVYVWNDANPPASAQIGVCRSDVETGGWSFEITLFDNADLDAVRDRALVILFEEAYYGNTAQSIGPVAGCENVLVTGWIARETINWSPEVGQVRFTAYGAHYWFQQIPAWPDGVELVTGTPEAWTQIQALTVNKGLFHFLRWRTTATRIMDCVLTDNTLFTKEVSSLAQNLWEQLREMAFLQIFARAGVNALNQLFVEVHPQLVPEASRTWPTVMTITKADWQDQIDIERRIVNEISILNLSGVSVNSSGASLSYFSLAPGHSHPRYGKPEIVDRLLLESQSQSNTLAGMYYDWRNNPYPEIPISLSANNRLIDCFPRQKCAISIAEGDTPRGITYSGNLIPTSVAYVQDPETGYLHTEVTFEAEAGLATNIMSVNGDVPGSGDISVPPSPSFPSLPPFPILIPGTPELDPEAPLPVLLHDTSKGFIYTADAGVSSPTWLTVNAGLSVHQYQNANFMFVCPNGSFWAGRIETVDDSNYQDANTCWIARAPSIGGTFVVLETGTTLKPSPSAGKSWGIFGAGYNPLVSEQVGIVMGTTTEDKKIHIGAGLSFAAGAVVDLASNGSGSLTYGLGKWLYTRSDHWERISANGASVLATGNVGNMMDIEVFSPFLSHIRASTTGKTFHGRFGGGMFVGDDNLASNVQYTDTDIIPVGIDTDPSGMLIILRYDTGKRGKSSDGGATWSLMPGLTFSDNWYWAYAGGAGSASRWVAAGGGSYVQLSSDFGGSWAVRQGNLASIIPTGPSTINLVLAVGF